MKYLSAPFIKAFFFACAYGIVFYLLQFFLVKTGIFPVRPTSVNLLSWDVSFYDSIRKGGYDPQSDNTGFFILFPLIWKVSHLGPWGIIALNTIFFSLGFAFLTRTLKEDDKTFWLFWLTLPSVYFIFVPYTEALFFLLGALIMYTLQKRKYGLLWIALFLASLVRATGFFLVPALLAMEILSSPSKDWWRAIFRSLYRYVLPVMLALALFVYWQYAETGIWFAYFKKQSEHWGHTFSLPEFPFTNIENAIWRYHWLSALAMLVDLVALIFLVGQGLLWLKNKERKEAGILLSAGYLAMALMSLLFLNPKYGGHNTNIMGANRYTIITPFFFVFMHYLSRKQYTTKQVLGCLAAVNVFWALFGAFKELSMYIVIGLPCTCLVAAFMLYRQQQKHSWMIIAVIAFNLLMQLQLFQQFITPLYVD